MKILNIFSTLAIISIASISATAQNILTIRDTITDPGFVYPESYEADTHRMMQNWYLQNYTVIDKEIQDPGDNPTTDAEYIERLMAMPTVIEMPFNSVVKSCIEMYTQRRRSLVERMLGMSIYYMPIFEQALENEGVPLELRYLPIIESALDPNAVSRAGATGLWQFMLPTARGLGLEINSLVDERRDPYRSSAMAARYLKQLHEIYNDWSLAIAAYNCGPGNVNKALRRAGEGKKDFWEIYPYLPPETRGYLPGFIAANYAMNYYDKHNISPALAKHPILTDSVHVTKRVHFQQIADVLNIPIDEIRLLNPQYRQDIIPGDIKPYSLVLPSRQVLSYIISEDSIIAHNAHLYARRDIVEPSDGTTRISEDGKYTITEVVKYHKVRKGETFTSIARRYGVTVASIKRVNGIKTLRRGRTIKIVTTKRTLREPEPEEPTPPVPPSEVEEIQSDSLAINVSEEVIPVTFDENAPSRSEGQDDAGRDNDNKREADNTDRTDTEGPSSEEESDGRPEPEATTAQGDTATVSAQQPANAADRHVQDTFNRQRQNAQQQNQASEETVEQEQQQEEVKSKPKPSKPAAPKAVYHKVKRGETLSKIARRYGTTVKKIQRLNPSISGTKINYGQRIRVK